MYQWIYVLTVHVSYNPVCTSLASQFFHHKVLIVVKLLLQSGQNHQILHGVSLAPTEQF